MSNVLKDIRAELEKTQSDMAAYMGVPLRTYQDLEQGTNPVRQIHKHALAWGISYFGGSAPMANKIYRKLMLEIV